VNVLRRRLVKIPLRSSVSDCCSSATVFITMSSPKANIPVMYGRKR
jgi:hypothetical protein